ncbi:MAG: homoserine dehydrogenase [Vampirovibrionales bacterium]|nr:homoserine dehydrogenase [Vampirovibrionales bacterium]
MTDVSPASTALQRLPHAEGAPKAATTPISPVGVGMIGMGTVGRGVYKILSQRSEIDFRRIAVRDLDKNRGVEGLDSRLLCDDPLSVVRDPEAQVLIEVMGGVDLARELIVEAIRNGKHVITANKELIAKEGQALFELAQAHHVRLMFEGAVAGGIPIIMPLKLSLAANHILEIAGILNGTTNYILTKMANEGWSYETALEKAQEKGFAEADPTNDVEGHDTAYKISILSSIAFKKRIDVARVAREGISRLTATDIQLADSLGYVIKLIGLCRQGLDPQGPLDVRVHPTLVLKDHPLASIHNENNAVWIKGDAVGDVMFYGRGAGELPTASAVCADVLAITDNLVKGNDPIPSMEIIYHGDALMAPAGEARNRYFVRLRTHDTPGVIGNIGTACGECGVSIESIVQHGIHEDGTASIVLITHIQSESQMQDALTRILAYPSVDSVACLLRIL